MDGGEKGVEVVSLKVVPPNRPRLANLCGQGFEGGIR